MAIIGYGEDGLTYWGLTSQLSAILDGLADDTDPKDCTIFFRPSFGRAGRAQFGLSVVLPRHPWGHLLSPSTSSVSSVKSVVPAFDSMF
jgi:hypothetical protein